jgi:hypothetical protein
VDSVIIAYIMRVTGFSSPMLQLCLWAQLHGTCCLWVANSITGATSATPSALELTQDITSTAVKITKNAIHAYRLLQSEISNSCQYDSDGTCDEPIRCAAGTDSTDCGSTAPATLTVTGLQCWPGANAVFELEANVVNGQPQWKALVEGGAYYFYWTPNSHSTGGPAWVIDNDASAAAYVYLISPGDVPPTGSAVWVETCSARCNCNGFHTTTRLAVVPTPPLGGCGLRLDMFVSSMQAACCGTTYTAECFITGPVPSTCSPDCAQQWRNFAAVCPKEAGTVDDRSIGHFFGTACGAPPLEVLPIMSISLPEGGRHDFPFTAEVGVRYAFTVRTSFDGGSCVNINAYDVQHGQGQCDHYIASGHRDAVCAPGAGCDASCGVGCTNNGNVDISVFILPAAAPTENDAYAVVLETSEAADKALAWTCRTSGKYLLRVSAFSGSGGLSAQGYAIGTAALRAPAARSDGSPFDLSVSCQFTNCAFNYGGANVYDGDGAAFDLRLSVTDGTAYAIAATLKDEQPGAYVKLTFYYPAVSGGVAAFAPALSGALGDWDETPTEHSSFPEHFGCSNADLPCWRKQIGAGSFHLYPGGSFPRHLSATWAAPAEGLVLLNVQMNCDVRFFADVDAEGCYIREDDYGCDSPSTNGECTAELSLSITTNAYFEQEGAAEAAEMFGQPLLSEVTNINTVTNQEGAAEAAEMFGQPVLGKASRVITIDVPSAEVEALAAEMFQTKWAAKIGHTLARPPTMTEMLVPGSEAEALMATLFTTQQQPHLTLPTAVMPVYVPDIGAPNQNGHRRQMQIQDPASQGEEIQTVRISLKAQAPTLTEVDAALAHFVGVRFGRRLLEEECMGLLEVKDVQLAAKDAQVRTPSWPRSWANFSLL